MMMGDGEDFGYFVLFCFFVGGKGDGRLVFLRPWLGVYLD